MARPKDVSFTRDTANVWWRTKGPDVHQQLNAKAAQWTPARRSGRDTTAKATFGEELVEFVGNISMHGYRWLVEPTFSAWEKSVECAPAECYFNVLILYMDFQLHLAGRPCGVGNRSCGRFEQGVHTLHDDANGDDALRHGLSNKFGSVSGHLDMQ